jgi:hypothetical protein
VPDRQSLHSPAPLVGLVSGQTRRAVLDQCPDVRKVRVYSDQGDVMMRKGHRAFSTAYWLGLTLPVAMISPDTVQLPAVALGAVLAYPMSAGRYCSPDIDHRWAPGPPRKNYDWRFHRGWTHRYWFASVVLLFTGTLPFFVLLRLGVPASAAIAIFGLPAGWWSHLAGDQIYGRLKVLGRARGLGWKTGGIAESGGSFLRDPAAKFFTLASAALAVGHLALQ